jgi:hypothetical protein
MSSISSHPHAEDLLTLVFRSIALVRPDLSGISPESLLVGTGAVLESVDLVSLLVTLEQSLDNRVDLASSLLQEPNVTVEDNPFRTAASLAEHIHHLMETA